LYFGQEKQESKQASKQAKEEENVGKNVYDVKRNEPVPLERGRYKSGFLPRAPHARTIGAEESYICICTYKRSQWAGERDFII